MTARRADLVAAAGIAVVALCVRGLYLGELRQTPFFTHLLLNAADYDAWARHGYPAGEPFYQAPLYIAFLDIVYALAGDAQRLAAARWVQAGLGAATAVLAFAIARLGWGRAAGIVAGSACALAAPLVFHEAELLPTALETFLLVASAAAVAALWARPPARRMRLGAWGFAGIVLGLGVTCRPTFLVLAPVVAVLAFRAAAGGGPRLAAAALAGAYLAGAAVPVAVVAARNLRAGQGFVLLTTNMGPNLLLAHNPEADGLNPFLPDRITRMRRTLVQSGATQVALSRAAADDALLYARAHPGRTLALWVKKLILFYNRYEIPNDRSIRDAVARSRLLRMPPVAWVGVGLLLPLACAGWVVRGRVPPLRALLGAALVAGALAYAPFIVCARFRTPFVPFLAILAGAALASLARRPQRRQWTAMAALATAGAILAWPGWFGVRARSEFVPLARNQARLFTDVAQSALQAGDRQRAEALLAEARAALERSVRDNAGSPEALESLAGFLTLQGDGEAAATAYERALALDPAATEARRGLALLATQEGEYAVAEVLLQEAMQLDPGRPDDALKLADVVFARGRFAEAIALYERAAAARTDPGVPATASAANAQYVQAQIELARARMAEHDGRFVAAESALVAAARALPANPTYKVELALFLHRHGRTAEALSLLRECARDPALPALRRTQLEELIRRVEGRG